MFRRHWSGLPKDVSFPSDLTELGYFINDEDEVRNIEYPDYYLKAFPDRNERVNFRYRFAFDHTLEKIIEERLSKEGLKKTPLPLGTPATKKHVPIFMSEGLDKKDKSKDRIVLFFGEALKPLGMLAGRVASGRGGVDKGSLVPLVKYLGAQVPLQERPGIIIANVGQLYWYPDEQRVLTAGASDRIPRRSLVDSGRKFVPESNQIDGHETPARHIAHIFEEVLPQVIGPDADTQIDVIAVGDTAEKVQLYLDQKKVWDRWGKRMSGMVLMDTICPENSLENEGFKNFLAKRARNYALCSSPTDMPIAPPTGNESLMIQSLGVPSYSSGEPDFLECILITGMEPILDYLMYNYMNPQAENEEIIAIDHGQIQEQQDEAPDPGVDPGVVIDDDTWGGLGDDDKPSLNVYPASKLEEQRQLNRGWKQYEETGHSVAPAALEAEAEAEAAKLAGN